MLDPDYEFCKIFVDSADRPAVVRLLGRVLGREADRGLLRLPAIEVEVVANPDAVPGSGDFVTWPTFVEVEAGEEAEAPAVVGVVSAALTALWEAAIPAVAAADYEDELPWNGGIDRLRATRATT